MQVWNGCSWHETVMPVPSPLVIAVFVQLAATVTCFVADQQVETKMFAATPAVRGCEPVARDQLMLKPDVHSYPPNRRF